MCPRPSFLGLAHFVSTANLEKLEKVKELKAAFARSVKFLFRQKNFHLRLTFEFFFTLQFFFQFWQSASNVSWSFLQQNKERFSGATKIETQLKMSFLTSVTSQILFRPKIFWIKWMKWMSDDRAFIRLHAAGIY